MLTYIDNGCLTMVAVFGRSLALAGIITLGLTACVPSLTSSGPPAPLSEIPAPEAPTSHSQNPEASVSTPIRVNITVNGTTVHAVLENNPASASLVSQLPLELSFEDFGTQEKIATLPAPLVLNGLPSGGRAKPGTVGYYAPDQAIVLYYDTVGYYDGIIPIGTFDDVDTVRDAPAFVGTISTD